MMRERNEVITYHGCVDIELVEYIDHLSAS